MHSDVYPDHDIGLRQILGVEKFVKVNLQISSVQILERLEEWVHQWVICEILIHCG